MDHYRVKLRHSPEDKVWIAEAPELPGCQAHGKTRASAVRALEQAIPLWLEVAAEEGRPIPQPHDPSKAYNGKILLRGPEWLHRELDEGAAENGVSLNQHLLALLAAGHGASRRAPLRAAKTQAHIPLVAKPGRRGIRLKD